MSDRHARAREALRAAEARAQAGAHRRVEPPGHAVQDEHTPSGQITAALRFVLRSTQNRPQTEAEIAGKLRQRDYPEDTVEHTLAAARQQGIVDDAAFAAAWVDDRGIRRGLGELRLRDELAARGVGAADIDAALSRLDDRDEHHTARELARTRARQLPASLGPAARVRRLGNYLMRRGHPPGLAERVAREIAGEPDGC